jgi:NUDIX domain
VPTREMNLSSGPQCFDVVAAVLVHRGRVCLLRRSPHVDSDRGRWHCITGYLPQRTDPMTQALAEIHEETGIGSPSLQLLDQRVVRLAGSDSNIWRVHAYRFRSVTDAVTLNWEHDEARWLRLGDIGSLATVQWLPNVLEALALSAPRVPARTVPQEKYAALQY